KYYTLTEAGIELIPVIIELWSWGAKHDPLSVVSQQDLQARTARKQEVISEFEASARALEF
ncbi:MAG: hypothetical protein AAF849_17305, partial [Bacteroidota bacterium]